MLRNVFLKSELACQRTSQMPSVELNSVIFLSGEAEAEALGNVLKEYNPRLIIHNAPTRAELDKICTNVSIGTRLISFCSPVIVPGAYLKLIDCGSYNFHPGPPSYPGRYPSVFALYEGAKNFGVTIHEMEARVDEGAIIAAEWFAVPSGCDLETLDTMAFKALVTTFRKLAKPLATAPSKLATKPIGWSGQKRSKADCDALCRIGPLLSDEEKEKRTRACGLHIRNSH